MPHDPLELFSRIFRNLDLQRDETNLWYPSRMYVLHEIPSFQKFGRKNRPNFLQKKKQKKKHTNYKKKILIDFPLQIHKQTINQAQDAQNKNPTNKRQPKKKIRFRNKSTRRRRKKRKKPIPLPRSFDPLLHVATISELSLPRRWNPMRRRLDAWNCIQKS